MVTSSVQIDPQGREIAPAAAPTELVSPIVHEYNPFAGRQSREEITFEQIVRLTQTTAPLSQRNALLKRVLRNDARFQSAYRTMCLAVSGLEAEMLPAEKVSRADKRMANRVADYCAAGIADLDMESLVYHLAGAEYFPFSMAENNYELRTKTLQGFELLDPARQRWDPSDSRLRVLTKRNQGIGEELAANMWTVHTSHLYPGGPLEGGCGAAVAFQYAIKHISVEEWVEYIDVYGMPWVLAFIKDPKERDSVIKAVQALSRSGRGAFPFGTEVKIEGAAHSSDYQIFDRLAMRADDEVGILFTGHDTIQVGKSGTGTLANKGAQTVHEKVVRKVARGCITTVKRDIVLPIATMRFGYDVAREFCSTWKLKYEPPRDVRGNAVAMKSINEVLAPRGLCIAEEEVTEAFGMKVVPITAKSNGGGQQDQGGDGGDDKAVDDTATEDAQRRQSGRARVAAAKASTPLETHDDVAELAGAIGRHSLQEMGQLIAKKLEGAASIEVFVASLYEEYEDLGPAGKRLASLTRDAITTSAVIGMGDANADT